MFWTARIGIGVIAVIAVMALLAEPPRAPAPGGQAFKDDWPAPDEESIEYLKGLDLRTLQTRDFGEPIPARVDLLGDPLPPGATLRLALGWGVSRLAVGADGLRIVTAGPPCSLRAAEVFDATTGRCLRRLGSYRGIVESLAISPDGRRLAVARSDFSGHRDAVGAITLYDLDTFEELRIFGDGTGPRALVFSADGRLISGGGDGILWVWDPETGEPVRRLADLTRKIVALAISSNGKVLATSSVDEVVRLWDVASGVPFQQIDQAAAALAISADGRHLATNRGVWELASGQELGERFRTSEAGSYLGVGLAFSPDGRSFASYEQERICLRELGTGQIRRSFQGGDGRVGRQLAFTADGRSVISGENYGEGLVWDLSGWDSPPQPARASDIEALLVALTDGQAGRAYTAMWGLVAAGDPAVPTLAQRLKESVPKPLDPNRLKRLIADLDHADFHVRDRVTLELENLGRDAEKALRGLLADRPPLEVRIRAEQIIRRIADRAGKLPQEMFRLRGVEVLENLATPAACQALTELASRDIDPELKDDARRSLDRLARKSPNPRP